MNVDPTPPGVRDAEPPAVGADTDGPRRGKEAGGGDDRGDADRRSANCPNCSARRSGRFCSRCGQNDRNYARSLTSVLREVLKETFELDSRLFRTLKLMALQPGELPGEFSRNRRASYASPVRLYLFASLLFFFVLSVSETTTSESFQIEMEPDSAGSGVEAQEPDPPGVGIAEPTPSEIEALKAVLPPEQQRKLDEIVGRPDSSWGLAFVSAMAAAARSEDFEADLNKATRFLLVRTIDAIHNPQLLGERLLNNLPIAMFFMLPVYAVLLACVYFPKRRFFAEHFVFGMHVHAVAFVVSTLLLLVRAAPEGAVATGLAIFLFVALGFHYYIALKRYYGDGWMSAAFKGGLLSMIYGILLIPSFLLVVFVTLSLG